MDMESVGAIPQVELNDLSGQIITLQSSHYRIVSNAVGPGKHLITCYYEYYYQINISPFKHE